MIRLVTTTVTVVTLVMGTIVLGLLPYELGVTWGHPLSGILGAVVVWIAVPVAVTHCLRHGLRGRG